nr:immunoglobulin heavy chain junction region [Mus musculus]MBK4186428.1 immunoglobulin heavy chain junction region [Mus musculus]MBK4186429.1 immunoglobulin heavy chain junction region [Mus musculus]MBK4195274.1 immunoglobulin heavy chain junction region [Mus musculus]
CARGDYYGSSYGIYW